MNKNILIFPFLACVFIVFSSLAYADNQFDVSIDRVLVAGNVVTESIFNIIEDSDDYVVQIELTAVSDLKNIHIEAKLKDKNNNAVSDSTTTFNLSKNQSSVSFLRLTLADKLKRQKEFELIIKVVDTHGNFEQKNYKLKTKITEIGRKLDVSIDKVEVEAQVITKDQNNLLLLKDEKELNVKVTLTSLENIDKLHIDAILTFEDGNVVSDSTKNFDINKDTTVIKKLDVPLTNFINIADTHFNLIIRIIDTEGNSIENVYGLKSGKRLPFFIGSISLNPENRVYASKNIVVRSTINSNINLEDINLKVTIPQIGLDSTKQISKTKNKFDTIEEVILKIPDNTPTGTYSLRVEGMLGDTIIDSKVMSISVIGKNDQIKQIINDRLIINVPILSQDIEKYRKNKNEKSEVIYPITLTNEGPDANAYTIVLDKSELLDLRLSESSAFVIKPKESKIINVYASTKSDLYKEQTFLVTIKSNDKTLHQIALKANIISKDDKSDFYKESIIILKIVVMMLILSLFAVGIFFGFKRHLYVFNTPINDKSKGKPKGKEYIEAYY